jgi:hypothetical protein
MAATALANVPAHLHQKGRHELIKHAMNIRNAMQKHKETAKHAGATMVDGIAASAGGGTAGVLAVKLPHVPKTKVRTDLVVGGLLGVAVAVGFFDEVGRHVGAFAHGMLGYGTGDAVKQALLAKGVKQAA